MADERIIAASGDPGEAVAGERCPTCGRRVPRADLRPLYASHDARVDGARAKAHDRMLDRADRDAREILPLLPETFRRADVCRAVRASGRFWSEGLAVLTRLERTGRVRETAPAWQGARMIQVWEKVPQEGPPCP